ncbi:MAG TPA: hypothetical protein VEY12_05345 [Thermoplasmata archaeon]|nr:hypothetical protein [Thermoplasmata archaeon]
MAALGYLTWAPLVSAAIWFSLSVYLVRLERYRTWTEVFFLGLCAATGSYALSDAVFFSMGNPSDAKVAATVSLGSLTFGGFLIFLYGMSLYRRFRAVLLVSIVPVAFFVITFYEMMFTDFQSISSTGSGAPYVPVYNPTWLYPWILLMLGLMGGGFYGVFRTYLEIRPQNPKVARRIGLTLLGLAVAAAVGAASNAYLAVTGYRVPPLFSSTLGLPGLLVFYATTPSALSRLNTMVLRRKESQYDVKGAFLTYSDGTLIGSKIQPEEQMIDADAFSATLDVIQNFMRTSFPTLRGKWLKSIRHGEFTLVMERGRHTYLTLVIGGQENDQLRRKVIERLTAFEKANQEPLSRWRGMAADAVGVDALLDSILTG